MLQAVLTRPVLSSDDDSDQENSNSSGDETKENRRSTPFSAAEGVTVQTRDSQGGIVTKDGGSGSEAGSRDRAESTPLLQGQEVFFTTTDFYLVLRLHHLLAKRFAEAKQLCREAGLSRQTVVACPPEVGVSPDWFVGWQRYMWCVVTRVCRGAPMNESRLLEGLTRDDRRPHPI